MSSTLNIKNLSALIRDIKKYIQDDYTDYELDEYNDNSKPYIQITIAANRDDIEKVNNKTLPISHMEWDYQTGDNSYSGNAYFYDTWAVDYIYRDTNSRELAKELINQLFDNGLI